jgi:hypothetical protein
MPLITVSEATSYGGDIAPGTYPATLVGIEADTIFVEGENRPVFKWRFALEDGTELEGLTSQITSLTSTTKSIQWLTALLGPEAVKVNASFDVDDLVGREALINIQPNKNGYPKVQDVLAMPKTAPKAKAKAQPIEADAEVTAF